VAVLATGMLPWASSGQRVRSGVELARVVRDVSWAHSPMIRVVLTLVALVPIIVTGGIVADLLDHPLIARTLVIAAGVVAVVAAVVVSTSSLHAEIGRTAGLLVGVLAIAAGAWPAGTRKERGGRQPGRFR
jgi:hypothetical protein